MIVWYVYREAPPATMVIFQLKSYHAVVRTVDVTVVDKMGVVTLTD